MVAFDISLDDYIVKLEICSMKLNFVIYLYTYIARKIELINYASNYSLPTSKRESIPPTRTIINMETDVKNYAQTQSKKKQEINCLTPFNVTVLFTKQQGNYCIIMLPTSHVYVEPKIYFLKMRKFYSFRPLFPFPLIRIILC